MFPKIDYNLSVSKNIEIIEMHDGKIGITSYEESKTAKDFILKAKPQCNEDYIRIYNLKQEVSNYDAIGESGYLRYCLKKAYDYIKRNKNNKTNKLAAQKTKK